jgi:hypothetical protein
MSFLFKATTPEGRMLIGCHTKDPEKQILAGVAIDLFTPLAGSNPAEFSPTGWTIRPVAPYVQQPLMDLVLKSAECELAKLPKSEEIEIDDIGIVTREMMTAYMGEATVRKVFKQIEAQPPQPAAPQIAA